VLKSIPSIVIFLLGFAAAHQTLCAQALTETIDVHSRWTLRVSGEAAVATALVRVGDVATMVGTPTTAWNRIASAPLALLPTNGDEITIDRNRLAALVDQADAVPAAIEWIGPKTIRVRRDAALARVPSAVQPVSFQTSPNQSPVASAISAATTARYQELENVEHLSVGEHQRIERLMLATIRRFYPEIESRYEASLIQSPELASLVRVGSIASAEPTSEIRAGTTRWNVVLRTATGNIETQLLIDLADHPRIVASTRTIPIGQRIAASDLQYQYVPADRLPTTYLTSIDEAVGMEAKMNLRSGSPVVPDAIGTPILVRRGDLIEVRVVAGGVSVTTNAKSLDDGSESQLIEVETISPKKRLVARVISSSVVEVATRSPVVR
jgi:flagellar basal body P-ring formation protein FlgA